MDQSVWQTSMSFDLLHFITHVNTNSIVMLVILRNNAEWDCFKTPILQEILRIQNLLRVEHCAFWEVIRLFQSVGCVTNKLQFRTVQQNQKSFPWTQDRGWTEDPHLIYGMWSSQFLETRIRVIKNGETRLWTNVKFVQHLTQFHNENNLKEWSMIWTIIYSVKRQLFSSGSFVVCVWRQRSSDQDDHKGKKPDNETCFQNPQSCSWLVIWSNQFGPKKTKSNTLTPKTNTQTYWQREISHVMNGIIFCVCSTSAISVLQIVLKRCWQERKKIQVKKESQQNRTRWWIWSRDAA